MKETSRHKTQKWSDHAWETAKPVYNQILQLPFIHELMNGTLPREKFNFYLQQDSIYLETYGRILGRIAVSLQKQEHLRSFLRFAGDTVAVEQALHKFFLKEKPMSATASPGCMLYTGFLHSLATQTPGIAVAGVLPCFRIYKTVGDFILENQTPNPNPYQQWINTYGGEEFAEATKEALQISDEIADQIKGPEREAMTAAFMTASRLEWIFWNSAWHMEQWPV
ncbi:MAG: TenA family protein [Mangrovibacterium sp.]